MDRQLAKNKSVTKTIWTPSVLFNMPPCGVRQHWRRHQRAGLEGVVGKQERGVHYKKRLNPEERQNHGRERRRGERETRGKVKVTGEKERRGKRQCLE